VAVCGLNPSCCPAMMNGNHRLSRTFCRTWGDCGVSIDTSQRAGGWCSVQAWVMARERGGAMT